MNQIEKQNTLEIYNEINKIEATNQSYYGSVSFFEENQDLITEEEKEKLKLMDYCINTDGPGKIDMQPTLMKDTITYLQDPGLDEEHLIQTTWNGTMNDYNHGVGVENNYLLRQLYTETKIHHFVIQPLIEIIKSYLLTQYQFNAVSNLITTPYFQWFTISGIALEKIMRNSFKVWMNTEIKPSEKMHVYHEPEPTIVLRRMYAVHLDRKIGLVESKNGGFFLIGLFFNLMIPLKFTNINEWAEKNDIELDDIELEDLDNKFIPSNGKNLKVILNMAISYQTIATKPYEKIKGWKILKSIDDNYEMDPLDDQNYLISTTFNNRRSDHHIYFNRDRPYTSIPLNDGTKRVLDVHRETYYRSNTDVDMDGPVYGIQEILGDETAISETAQWFITFQIRKYTRANPTFADTPTLQNLHRVIPSTYTTHTVQLEHSSQKLPKCEKCQQDHLGHNCIEDKKLKLEKELNEKIKTEKYKKKFKNSMRIKELKIWDHSSKIRLADAVIRMLNRMENKELNMSVAQFESLSIQAGLNEPQGIVMMKYENKSERDMLINFRTELRNKREQKEMEEQKMIEAFLQESETNEEEKGSNRIILDTDNIGNNDRGTKRRAENKMVRGNKKQKLMDHKEDK